MRKHKTPTDGEAPSIPPLPGDHPLPEDLPPYPGEEQMLLPCVVEWAGTTYGPGAVVITSARMRRALERAVENSGYEFGEPIEQVETPVDLPAGEQVGEGS